MPAVRLFSGSFQNDPHPLDPRQRGVNGYDFEAHAEQKGFTQNHHLVAGVKAGAAVQCPKDDFELGHGHAMAIFALLKESKSEESV